MTRGAPQLGYKPSVTSPILKNDVSALLRGSTQLTFMEDGEAASFNSFNSAAATSTKDGWNLPAVN